VNIVFQRYAGGGVAFMASASVIISVNAIAAGEAKCVTEVSTCGPIFVCVCVCVCV